MRDSLLLFPLHVFMAPIGANLRFKKKVFIFFLYTLVRASWIEFNNCPTRCDLFSLLHFCRQLYLFRVSTPETCRAAYRNI